MGVQQAAFASLLILTAIPTALLARRFFGIAERPEYLIPDEGRVIVGVALLGMLVAAVVGLQKCRGIVAALAALATVSLIFGVLFTLVGLPLIALGVVATLAAVRMSRHSPRLHMLAAAVSGLTLGLGFAFLVIVGTHSPLIDCRTNTGSVGYWYWPGGPSSSSGVGSSSVGGELRGSVSFDGATYEYVCVGNALSSFQRVE